MGAPRTFEHCDTVALTCNNHVIPRIRIARTFAARCVGLLNRSRLDPHEGLLFVPGGSIHTLGMRFDIDVIFLSAVLEVLSVAAQTRPWRFVIAPIGTCFVLELTAGVATHVGVELGSRFKRVANPVHLGESRVHESMQV